MSLHRRILSSPRGGFTLVEVVVVIANIALLSAILVPLVGRQIEEAKKSRAQNECQILAAAVLKFYGDVGIWPANSLFTGNVLKSNVVKSLVSGTAVATIDSSSSGLTYGYTSASNDNWYDCGQGMVMISPNPVDIFDHHLNQNEPFSNATLAYPTVGEIVWKGPYLPPIGDDPWGHHYICNINRAYAGSDKLCVVLSAGPNGAIDTAVDPASNASPSGDDIWAVVAIRP